MLTMIAEVVMTCMQIVFAADEQQDRPDYRKQEAFHTITKIGQKIT